MSKYKVFISSVQSEFANERQLLYDFIRQDELMGQFFEPFIFEQIAAQNTNPRQLYLDEASTCQVYLLLIGQHYGNAPVGDISPTEKEYQAAGRNDAYRVAFIKDLGERAREQQEERFFRKVQNELSYRIFSNPSVLISLTKQSLYAYLKYKGIVQTRSLDEQVRDDATMDDIDPRKVSEFVHQARQKRHFPLAEAMFQAGYIEKYGTGITENIRKMHEAHLLAPVIDLSAEFITTIWRGNDATTPANVATSASNVATNIATPASNVATSASNEATFPLDNNKRIIDEIVSKKVKSKMTAEELIACIVEACIVEHSVDELGLLLHKAPKHLRDGFIPQLVADGTLLRTKPQHSPGQTYITNPKFRK